MKIECDLCCCGAILIIGITAVVTWALVSKDCPMESESTPFNSTKQTGHVDEYEYDEDEKEGRDPIGEDQDLRPYYKYCRFCQLYKSPTAVFYINDSVRNATKGCLQLSCAENRTINGEL
jgi:hypothetical protein